MQKQNRIKVVNCHDLILEGPDSTIQDLIDNIMKDPRHRQIIVVMDRQIETREFGHWKMAFRSLKYTNQEAFSIWEQANFGTFHEGMTRNLLPQQEHSKEVTTLIRVYQDLLMGWR